MLNHFPFGHTTIWPWKLMILLLLLFVPKVTDSLMRMVTMMMTMTNWSGPIQQQQKKKKTDTQNAHDSNAEFNVRRANNSFESHKICIICNCRISFGIQIELSAYSNGVRANAIRP